MSDLGKALCDGLASALSDHDKAKRFFENLAQLRDDFNVSDMGKNVLKNAQA